MSFEYGLSNKNKTTLIYNGFEYTKKQSTKTTVHWICRYVKQFSCKATIITCGDTIIRFPKEHCCRYVPGEAEARTIVAAMKETSLYTGNTDAITTSLASVSENLCVQLSMPKKTLITRILNRHRQKNNMNDLPVLPDTKKFEVPEEFKDFLIYDSGTEDPERLLIFGQQTLSGVQNWRKNSLLESYRSFAVKKDFMKRMKTFLFAIWFSNSSSSFPFLIQHFFFSWCFHWVTINGSPVASSPGCQSCALPLFTALLCSHIRTMPMKLQSVTEEQTNLLKE